MPLCCNSASLLETMTSLSPWIMYVGTWTHLKSFRLSSSRKAIALLIVPIPGADKAMSLNQSTTATECCCAKSCLLKFWHSCGLSVSARLIRSLISCMVFPYGKPGRCVKHGAAAESRISLHTLAPLSDTQRFDGREAIRE